MPAPPARCSTVIPVPVPARSQRAVSDVAPRARSAMPGPIRRRAARPTTRARSKGTAAPSRTTAAASSTSDHARTRPATPPSANPATCATPACTRKSATMDRVPSATRQANRAVAASAARPGKSARTASAALRTRPVRAPEPARPAYRSTPGHAPAGVPRACNAARASASNAPRAAARTREDAGASAPIAWKTSTSISSTAPASVRAAGVPAELVV